MTATALATRDLFGVPFADTIARSASLSRCGAYRFSLTRTWSSEGGHVCFIGLNPSTADHRQDDPTVRRWVHFARSWGYGGFTAVNLYPLRTPSPVECRAWAQFMDNGPDWHACDVIHFSNLQQLVREAKAAALVVACWGAGVWDPEFVDQVLEEITTGEAVSARRDGGGFVISLADGRETSARRLLVASGLVDQLPDLPGVRELWGHDVLHCPYCHGWEVRDQPIGVLAASPMSMHQALMFRQLSDDVIYFRHDAPDLTEDQAEQLTALGIPVVTERVVGLELTGGRLSGVRLADGSVVPRAALTVAPQFVAHSPVLESLGLPAVPDPRGMGSSYLAEPTGLTAVPGVYVAGNVADLTGQVVTSAGQGLMAGAMINADLIAEDAAAAVAAHRQLVGAR